MSKIYEIGYTDDKEEFAKCKKRTNSEIFLNTKSQAFTDVNFYKTIKF